MARRLSYLMALSTALLGALVACTAVHIAAPDQPLGRLLQPPAPVSGVIPAVPMPTGDASASFPYYMVSLREVERSVKSVLARGGLVDEPLALGRLTDIWGYRMDDKGVHLIGAIGEGTPILIEQVAAAFRISHHEAIGMSLVPENPAQPASPQKVVVFPPELEDTRLIAPLIVRDYQVKNEIFQVLNARYQNEIKRCSESRAASREVTLARVVFLPDEPVLELERDDKGLTVWIRKADVVLTPEHDLLAASGQLAGSLPPDPALSGFTKDFNRRFPASPLDYEVQNIFKLFLVAQLLHAEQLPDDLRFWLAEYPLPRYPTPRELPGFAPKTFARTCYGRPYAPTEYQGVRRERQLWGGVIIAYRQYFGLGHSQGLDLTRAIGSSVTARIATSLAPALPPSNRLSLPRAGFVLPSVAKRR